jgi:hypothetical protein
MGTAFAPDDARWGTLTDVRRGGSHLFLRYSFLKSEALSRIKSHIFNTPGRHGRPTGK